MTNPNRKQIGQYAIVDAEGSFDSAGKNKSWVYGAYSDIDEAIRAAKRMRQVQIIRGGGNFEKGELVHHDAIGSTYERVAYS